MTVISFPGRRAAPPEPANDSQEPEGEYLGTVHVYMMPDGQTKGLTEGPFRDDQLGEVAMAKALTELAVAFGFDTVGTRHETGIDALQDDHGLLALVAIYHSSKVRTYLTEHIERNEKTNDWLMSRLMDAHLTMTDLLDDREAQPCPKTPA